MSDNFIMETITTNDTIAQFMEKCNNNFAKIVANGGGPKGADGVDGGDGPQGKDGNKIYVNESIIDSSKTYDDYLEDKYEDGDIVFFSTTGVIGSIKTREVIENGTKRYEHYFSSAKSLVGRTGDKGNNGDKASDQFDANDKYLVLSSEFDGIVLPRPTEENPFTPTNPLCINCNYKDSDGNEQKDRGISFAVDSNEKASIKIKDGSEFTIATDTDTLSLKAYKEIIAGEYDNGNYTDYINLYTNKKINLNIANSTNKVSVSNEDICLNVDGKSQFNGKVNVVGMMESNSIKTTNASISTLNVTGDGTFSSNLIAKKIKNITDNNLNIESDKSLTMSGTNNISLTSNGYVNINNSLMAKGGKICRNSENTSDPILSSSEIRGTIGDDTFVYMGMPLYSMMISPKLARVPDHWIAWDRSIVLECKSVTNKSITDANENKYLNISDTIRANIVEVTNIHFIGYSGEKLEVLQENLDTNTFTKINFGELEFDGSQLFTNGKTSGLTTSGDSNDTMGTLISAGKKLTSGLTLTPSSSTPSSSGTTSGTSSSSSSSMSSANTADVSASISGVTNGDGTGTSNGSTTGSTTSSSSSVSSDVSDLVASMDLENAQNVIESKLDSVVAKFTKNMLFSGKTTAIRKLPSNATLINTQSALPALVKDTSVLSSSLTPGSTLSNVVVTSCVIIPPPTAPDGYVWIFKYE